MRERLGKILTHPLTLCLAIFCCCFCLAVLLFLPLEPFARQLEQIARKQGVELQIDRPQLLFPPGIGAVETLISHRQFPHPPVSLSKVALHPLWTTLIGDNPGASFEFKAFSGEIGGEAFQDGTLSALFNNLIINEQVPQLGLVIDGNQLQGEFSGRLPLEGKNRSELQFSMNNLRLSGLQKFGSRDDILPIGQLRCRAEAEGPLLKINTLEVTGAAFDLSGNGSIRLGRTARSSSVTLNLTISPKSAIDPFLTEMLSLLKKPQPDGSYQLKLRGNLENVSL